MKRTIESLGEYLLLIYEIILNLFSPPFEKNILINQIYEVGLKSLPVCLMTSVTVGMVLALQTGMASISVLNEPAYIGTVVTFSLMKELGPMLTAVVLVGRVGAAITAELGSMRVTEQIDAMYTLGTDPIKYFNRHNRRRDNKLFKV
jgi:phospholipid/cholesterol/gamma-HCH transport system permease protein